MYVHFFSSDLVKADWRKQTTIVNTKLNLVNVPTLSQMEW